MSVEALEMASFLIGYKIDGMMTLWWQYCQLRMVSKHYLWTTLKYGNSYRNTENID